MRRVRRTTVLAGTACALALALAGCRAETHASAGSRPKLAPSAAHNMPDARPVASKPLRSGERLTRLQMPTAYTPSAPYGVGTDDYRCFDLDPRLTSDRFITGLNILPGQRKVVHHVILFRVPPGQVGAVAAKDRADKGEGWTCFGATGVDGVDGADPGSGSSPGSGGLDDAPWLGAWAPGGSEQVMAPGIGVPLAKGSHIVMQVHYNLLAGPRPDVSSAQLRLAPGTDRLKPLRTMLLPAPVELPCRAAHASGPLCDRDRSVADAEKRFGPVGQAADFLHLLCGKVHAGPVQSCTRTVSRPATIRAAAGHMHLLGRSIRIDVNPGTPRARTVLDIRHWDFDDQGAKPVRPVRLRAGDSVRVTCRHSQVLRDRLPAFEGQQEKYVVWGEGTTDEMCLGLLLATPS